MLLSRRCAHTLSEGSYITSGPLVSVLHLRQHTRCFASLPGGTARGHGIGRNKGGFSSPLFPLDCFYLIVHKMSVLASPPHFHELPESSVKGFELRFANRVRPWGSAQRFAVRELLFNTSWPASLDLQIAEKSKTGRFAGEKKNHPGTNYRYS